MQSKEGQFDSSVTWP
nr:unnamed protein product [Callosobruchus chinensis]CAH7759708.1 unnamed protein product [Callosobruchus chinensis]